MSRIKWSPELLAEEFSSIPWTNGNTNESYDEQREGFPKVDASRESNTLPKKIRAKVTQWVIVSQFHAFLWYGS